MNTLAPKDGVPGPSQAGASGSSPEASIFWAEVFFLITINGYNQYYWLCNKYGVTAF
jgi:hypothetical protein